jgi:hypothetical protein
MHIYIYIYWSQSHILNDLLLDCIVNCFKGTCCALTADLLNRKILDPISVKKDPRHQDTSTK